MSKKPPESIKSLNQLIQKYILKNLAVKVVMML